MMDGRRTILITGSTDGLGRRVAERLAAPDTLMLVHGRDAARGHAVVAAIEAAGGSAVFHQADFAELDAVRRMAEAIAKDHPQIDVLINNAGIALTRGQRQLSADGHELTFAVNYLAPFLLTRMLLPCLGRTRPSRIVNVASAGQAPIDFDDVMLERGYEGMRAYCQSKLAEIMFTFDLAEELDAAKVASVSLHPATYMDTRMVREGGIQPINTVDLGADAVLALVNAPGDKVSGRYFDVKREARAHAQAYDRAARRRLRDLSVTLTGA
jgi:NAD(P)-dependent dehydrogenase (short-subunit alcohol dehydrogenase family)